MDVSNLPRVVARSTPEGAVPLIAVEGDAYDCGREYGEIVLSRYPGNREYLDMAYDWRDLTAESRRLLEKYAPQLIDVYRGLVDAAGPRQAPSPQPDAKSGCTAFALHPRVTLDGIPISGQTKDTPLNRIPRYITLRMRIRNAPTILVLCYPGEVLGYGMWSNGMCRYRHNLYALAGTRKSELNPNALSFLQFASGSLEEAAELTRKHGSQAAAGALLTDKTGEAVAIDTCAADAPGFVWSRDGILTRSNHSEAPELSSFAKFPTKLAEDDSRYRTHGLRRLLEAEAGRLTPQKALQIISDHSAYPCGPCKHWSDNGEVTTSFIMCEPSRGLIHVTRGQPCCNWPTTYSV